MVAVDIFRLKDGKVVEHWDLMQEEVSAANSAVMQWEKVPPINLFKNNTAAFIHDLPSEAISNVAGDSNYARIQVLTPVGVWIVTSNSE